MDLYNALISQLEQYNYTRLILLVVEIFTFITGIFFYKKLTKEKVLVWYIFFDLVLFISSLVTDTLTLIPSKQISILNNAINLSVSVIEIFAYFLYFNNNFTRRIIKSITIPTLFTLALYLILESSNVEPFFKISFRSISYLISSLSFLLILPLSILNMRSLLNNSKITSITGEPEFWITIGILYYSSISIPFYFFRGFFDMSKESTILLDTALFYTPFILNLICILIAFLCRKQAKS